MMINIRGSPKKILEQHQNLRSNIRNTERPNYSPEDRSLLIHDDVSEMFSDQSSSLKEINDKDIPLEKRNIINDPSYFKQLSLSFYGTPPSPQKSITKNESNQYNFKPSPKLEHSLSPRSNETYYYGFKKSLNSPFEREPFMKTAYNTTKNIQNSQISLSNSKINLTHIRDQKMDKFEPESPRGATVFTDLSKYKAFRVNLNNILTTQMRDQGLDPYSQFSTGQTTLSATTPRQHNNWIKGSGKEIGSPRVKKIINTKTKGVAKDYLLTEPSALKSPKYNQIPKKLKMYALDNSSMNNLKNAMISEAKTPTGISKAGLTDKTPARPIISKGLQGIITRTGPLTNRKVTKNSSYYD